MAKKIVIILLIIVAFFLFANHGKNYNSIDELYEAMQAKYKSNNNLSFLMKMSISNIETQSIIRKKGDLIRIESSLDGGKSYPTISLKTNEGNFTYAPSSNVAYQTSADVEDQLKILDWGANGLSDATIGMRTTRNRQKCILVDVKSKNNETTYCIDEKLGIPIFMETRDAKGLVDASYEIQSISTNKISDVYFKLPENVKVVKNAI